MGAFSLFYRCIFLLACIDNWNIYNKLVTSCTVKTAAGVKCLCSTSEKASLSLVFPFQIICLRAPQPIVKSGV